MVPTTAGFRSCWNQEGDEASEASGAIVIVGKADSGADCEQPGHVIDKSAACLDEQEAGGIGKTGSVTGSTHDCGSEQVAHAHKNTCDGKRRDGKHQRFAELLEVLHHIGISSNLSFVVHQRVPCPRLVHTGFSACRHWCANLDNPVPFLGLLVCTVAHTQFKRPPHFVQITISLPNGYFWPVNGNLRR